MDFKDLILLLAVVLVMFLGDKRSYGAEGRRSLSKEEDLELERQLKILNKPPIKTIRTKIGDIFDCIDIYKQPAFDHPLLKNHKIQMKPDDFIQEETINRTASSMAMVSKTMLQLHREKCPPGTVPIKRTTKEALINAKYFSKQAKPYQMHSTYPYKPMNYHFTSLEPSVEGAIYYGGKAVIVLENPAVAPDQFSTAQLWIQNGPETELNSIEFGWAVYPGLLGDNYTRIFGYWTADGYQKTGCFNMLCSGFVQVDSRLALGDAVTKTAIRIRKNWVLIAMVYQESKTGNWWLVLGDEAVKVGYWPKELFTHLPNASLVRYGGVAGAAPNRPTPPMGNGHSAIYMESSTMSNMKVIDEHGALVDFDPIATKLKCRQDTSSRCYSLIFSGYVDKFYELSMSYGGPGGMCT